MIAKPQVRVVMRFRPLNATEERQQLKHRKISNNNNSNKNNNNNIIISDVLSPCIEYDEYSVEVKERGTPLNDGRQSPSTAPRSFSPSPSLIHNNNNNNNTLIDPAPTPTVSEASSFPTTALIKYSTSKYFTFDAILPESATQSEVYNKIGAPVVSYLLKGYNGTILAYGQTGSGKTHSMIGPAGGRTNVFTNENKNYNLRGLIPRIVEEIFTQLYTFDKSERTWRITVTMYEIYRETIFDLLRTGPQESEYKIREDAINKNVYVESLQHYECKTSQELLEIMHQATQRRRTAATTHNHNSSRSHCLFTIYLEQQDLITGGTLILSKLNLVDLAGSEKVCKTLAAGERLKEAQCINLSLTLLGNVIHRLTDGKSGYVPYRDSKLTRVLQESLGGNSLTTLLCHASTSIYNRDETVSTLRFAQRAKRVRNRPRVNRQFTPKEMQIQHACALDQIKQLEERLQVQNDLLEEQQLAISNKSKCGESEKINALVLSLMNQVEDLKKDIYIKEEELQHEKDSVEFYKQQCTVLKKELVDVCAQNQEQETKLINTNRNIEKERDNLIIELEALELELISAKREDWKPLAPPNLTGLPNSLTLQCTENGDSNNNNNINDNTNERIFTPDSNNRDMTITHHMSSLKTLVFTKPQKELLNPTIQQGSCVNEENNNNNNKEEVSMTIHNSKEIDKTSKQMNEKATMTEIKEVNEMFTNTETTNEIKQINEMSTMTEIKEVNEMFTNTETTNEIKQINEMSTMTETTNEIKQINEMSTMTETTNEIKQMNEMASMTETKEMNEIATMTEIKDKMKQMNEMATITEITNELKQMNEMGTNTEIKEVNEMSTNTETTNEIKQINEMSTMTETTEEFKQINEIATMTENREEFKQIKEMSTNTEIKEEIKQINEMATNTEIKEISEMSTMTETTEEFKQMNKMSTKAEITNELKHYKQQQEEEEDNDKTMTETCLIKDASLPAQIPMSIQTIQDIIAPLGSPDILNIQIRQALRIITSTLQNINRRDPVEILQSFELQWGHVLSGDEPIETAIPRDILLSTLYVARDVLLENANNNNNNNEIKSVSKRNKELPQMALNTLYNISQRENIGILTPFTSNEVIQAFEILRNNSNINIVEPHENNIHYIEDSGNFSDCVTVCEHTSLEVASARRILNTTLNRVIASMNPEMFSVLMQRLRSGLTLEETNLASRLLQDHMFALQGVENIRVAMVQEETCEAVQLLEHIILNSDNTSHQTKESVLLLSSPSNLEISPKLERVLEDSYDNLTSDRVMEALQNLQSYTRLHSDADINLMNLYHREELQEAIKVLERNLVSASLNNDINSDDNSNSNSSNNNYFTRNNSNNNNNEYEVQNDLQRALWVLTSYTTLLRDLYNNSSNNNNNIDDNDNSNNNESRNISNFISPSVIHALTVILRLLDGVAENYNNSLSSTHINSIFVLREACKSLEETIKQCNSYLRSCQENIEMTMTRRAILLEEKDQEEAEVSIHSQEISKDKSTISSSTNHPPPPPLDQALFLEQGDDVNKQKSLNNNNNNDIIIIKKSDSPILRAPSFPLTLSRTPSTRPRSTESTPIIKIIPTTTTTIINNREITTTTLSTINREIQTKDVKAIAAAFLEGNVKKQIMKDVSVMTDDNYKVNISLQYDDNDNEIENKREMYDEMVQTKETISDINECMKFLIDVRCLLGKTEEKEKLGVVEMLTIISNLQRELIHLKKVQEPEFEKELAQKKQEIETVYNALSKLQKLIQDQEHEEYEVIKNNKENESHVHYNNVNINPSISRTRSMPRMLREEISSKLSPLIKSSGPLRHASSFIISSSSSSTTINNNNNNNNNNNDNSISNNKKKHNIISNTSLNKIFQIMGCGKAAERVVNDVSKWFHIWFTQHEYLIRHHRETSKRADHLEILLQQRTRERDENQTNINLLKEALEQIKNENEMMRELLDSLHVDLETYMQHAIKQRAESEMLKGTAGQTEFCTMAEIELNMKLDDLRAAQIELVRLRSLHDKELISRKRRLLLHTLGELAKFTCKLTIMLQKQQPFNTGTLESQRLTLLKEASNFMIKVKEAQASI